MNDLLDPQLGGATLAVQVLVVFFVLALATLLLLSGLTALLAGLAGLVLLLAGLIALLPRLSALLAGLTTLLFVFFHIVCHEIFLPWSTLRGALCNLNRLLSISC
jgi:hypothetical protein